MTRDELDQQKKFYRRFYPWSCPGCHRRYAMSGACPIRICPDCEPDRWQEWHKPLPQPAASVAPAVGKRPRHTDEFPVRVLRIVLLTLLRWLRKVSAR